MRCNTRTCRIWPWQLVGVGRWGWGDAGGDQQLHHLGDVPSLSVSKLDVWGHLRFPQSNQEEKQVPERIQSFLPGCKVSFWPCFFKAKSCPQSPKQGQGVSPQQEAREKVDHVRDFPVMVQSRAPARRRTLLLHALISF